MNSQARPSILAEELFTRLLAWKFNDPKHMENITNSGNVISSTLGTSEDKTFTVFIIHDFLKMFDEPIIIFSINSVDNRTEESYLSRLS